MRRQSYLAIICAIMLGLGLTACGWGTEEDDIGLVPVVFNMTVEGDGLRTALDTACPAVLTDGIASTAFNYTGSFTIDSDDLGSSLDLLQALTISGLQLSTSNSSSMNYLLELAIASGPSGGTLTQTVNQDSPLGSSPHVFTILEQPDITAAVKEGAIDVQLSGMVDCTLSASFAPSYTLTATLASLVGVSLET